MEPTDIFPDWNNPNTRSYESLKSGVLRIDDTKLKSFIPKPEDVDYEKGYIPRYFIAKSWLPSSILEVSPDTYNGDFNSLNKGAYVRTKLNWYISGNLKDVIMNGGYQQGVISKNTKAIDNAKRVLPAITRLRSNLLAYYRSENLYTSGGEFTISPGSGESYVGAYHINPGIGPMVGADHTSNPHPILYPMDGTNPVDIGNLIGGGF
tara:strand:+ start:865 stop:1485 length:621 start_codon:yes stop_codon:yes gene_type:complete